MNIIVRTAIKFTNCGEACTRQRNAPALSVPYKCRSLFPGARFSSKAAGGMQTGTARKRTRKVRTAGLRIQRSAVRRRIMRSLCAQHAVNTSGGLQEWSIQKLLKAGPVLAQNILNPEKRNEKLLTAGDGVARPLLRIHGGSIRCHNVL